MAVTSLGGKRRFGIKVKAEASVEDGQVSLISGKNGEPSHELFLQG